jgi:RNA polymerase sigma-70 factor, ECF subfamily
MNDFISDDDLMQQFSDCSREAYNELIKRKKKQIYNRIINLYHQDYDTAQDILQVIMINVFKAKLTYNHKQKFNTWLFNITKNTVLNEIKRNKRILKVDKIYSDKDEKNYFIDGDDPNEPYINPDIIRNELLKLKSKYRDILLLKFYENKSMEEIAEITGENFYTLRTRLNRALELLNKNLNSFLNEK